jgi:hypothetical protein
VSRAQDHHVTIERRGRSHKAVCSCSWKSHAWNELRPAEADAWHHVYGDDVIVDVSSIPDNRPGADQPTAKGGGRPPGDDRRRAVHDLVEQARELASRPSPYTKNAAPELWRRSGESRLTVTAAVGDIEELLARHDRRSSGAADSEWLQLITAKRLLLDSLSYEEETNPRMPGGALI